MSPIMLSANANAHSAIHHPLSTDPPRGNAQPRAVSSSATPRRRGRRGSNSNNNQCTLSNSRSTPALQELDQTAGSQLSQSLVIPKPSVDIKEQQTKHLPRSVRWRLALGLLTRSRGKRNEQEKLLKSIEDLNALKLRFQRSRYDELEKKHYWKSTPVGIADESNNNNEGMDASSHSLHHVAPGDDPLSALLDKPKSKADDKKGNMFGGNGIFRTRSKSRDFNPKSSATSLKSSDGKKSSFTSLKSSDGEDEACKGSRWADFYSTKEVLGIIEKDLDRLPSDHYTIFHEWRLKHQAWKDHMEKEEEWKRRQQEKEEDELDMSNKSLERPDQTSAPSQPAAEPSLKQSWTFGQSFLTKKKVKSMVDLQALLELNSDDDEEETQRKQEEKEKADVKVSIRERAERLSQILFVYAREHPEIGYRQGMHEILSYVLLALEMDMLEQTVLSERKRWRRNSLSFAPGPSVVAEEPNGATAGVDSSGNMVVIHLLDPNYIVHDAFNLFEYIMTSLSPAYDAVPAGDEEANTEWGESPMEKMTSSIVSKIRFVARDEQLYGHVLCMPVPPQLYFAKWIRLMFGREVAGGMKSVMGLWDAFFDLASLLSSDEVPITIALLDVLKASACAMILLIRHQLLAPSMAPNGMMTGEPDPNIGIGYLMNYPPLEDIGPLLETISNLLSKEKKLVKGYQVTKERRLSEQDLPSEEYEVASNAIDHPLMNENPPTQFTDPLTYGNGQYNDISENLPRVYRMGGNSQTPLQKHDVAESLGNIADLAGGLLDFGSKTASAAIASIQKKYEVHKHAAIDHPLQNDAFPSNVRNSGSAEQNKDFVIQYRSYAPKSSRHDKTNALQSSINQGEEFCEAGETPKTKTATFVQVPMGQNLALPKGDDKIATENTNEDDSVNGLISESAEKDDSDTEGGSSDDSFSSKISSPIRESIQKSPKELATMLEKSVSTLMSHFNDRLSSEGSVDGGPLGNSQHSMIPDEIWDAMAEIDLVRKELMNQAALTDLAKSCSSLRSSSNSHSGGRSGKKGGRTSWYL